MYVELFEFVRDYAKCLTRFKNNLILSNLEARLLLSPLDR